MVKFLCYLTLFASIAKPGAIFPWRMDRPFFVLAGLTLVVFVAQRLLRGQPISSLPQRRYIYAIVAVYTLSIAQSGWLGGTVATAILWGKIAIVFTLLADVNESVADVRRSLFATVLAVVVLTFVGWRIYLYTPELLSNEGRLESVGDYNLSNSFALALTVGGAMLLTLFETTNSFLKKVLYFGILAVFAVSCVYTKSRGGNLGFASAVIVSLLLSSKVRSVILKAALAGLTVLGAAAAIPIILTRSDVSGYIGGDASASDRLMVWAAAFRMTLDHPLLGVGYGMFAEYVRDYGADKKLLAHNTLISVIAETGIIGGILYVLIIFITLRTLWRAWQLAKKDPKYEDVAGLARGMFITLVAFLINTSFSVKDADPLLWATLGISASVIVVFRKIVGTDPDTVYREAAKAASDAPLGGRA
jgi:putative inorganic carbon (hco3(-)) transporter